MKYKKVKMTLLVKKRTKGVQLLPILMQIFYPTELFEKTALHIATHNLTIIHTTSVIIKQIIR